MRPFISGLATSAVSIGLLTSLPAAATPFFFSTGNPNGLMATATRPDTGGKFEIESADDFVLTGPTSITSATFTGILTGRASAGDVGQVVVEIYRVFPDLSDVSRTSGPPNFSTNQVPTRVNSPSDVALDARDSAANGLTFSTATLGDFAAANSVQPGGINPKPGQTTGGDGPVTGTEVVFTANFTTPFNLAPGHYFFVPQVEVLGQDEEFLWLSAPKPIVAPGTPFLPDLQSWTRDQFLDPDWLRIGTDIVGAGAFNATFTLAGTIPEPASIGLLGAALSAMAVAGLRRRRQS